MRIAVGNLKVDIARLGAIFRCVPDSATFSSSPYVVAFGDYTLDLVKLEKLCRFGDDSDGHWATVGGRAIFIPHSTDSGASLHASTLADVHKAVLSRNPNTRDSEELKSVVKAEHKSAIDRHIAGGGKAPAKVMADHKETPSEKRTGDKLHQEIENVSGHRAASPEEFADTAVHDLKTGTRGVTLNQGAAGFVTKNGDVIRVGAHQDAIIAAEHLGIPMGEFDESFQEPKERLQKRGFVRVGIEKDDKGGHAPWADIAHSPITSGHLNGIKRMAKATGGSLTWDMGGMHGEGSASLESALRVHGLHPDSPGSSPEVNHKDYLKHHDKAMAAHGKAIDKIISKAGPDDFKEGSEVMQQIKPHQEAQQAHLRAYNAHSQASPDAISLSREANASSAKLGVKLPQSNPTFSASLAGLRASRESMAGFRI